MSHRPSTVKEISELSPTKFPPETAQTCVLAGATSRHEHRPFVLLAGHLDTVPAQ